MPRPAARDALVPPPGGWPAEPCGSDAERLAFARLLWSLPSDGSERAESDDPATVASLLQRHAVLLLNDLQNRADLPAMRDHRDRLNDLAATVAKLRSQLHHFSGEEGVLRLRATQSAFARHSALSRLAQPYGFDFLEELEPYLLALEQVAREEVQTIQTLAGGPGHTRLHDRIFFDPRHVLAARSAHVVFIFCGPQRVRTTDGGTVHRVMNHVWTDATGLAPDDCGVAAFLKPGIQSFRRNIVILNRMKIRRLPT